MTQEKIVLTGFKPTGRPHLGNYLGMLKPSMALMREEKRRCFYFLADLHALNVVQEPALLRSYTYDAAACWLALGLDTSKVVFYRDSDVPQIGQMASLLAPLLPKSLLNMAHAYKAATAKNKEAGKSDHDVDEGISIGLYQYPLLMAADILALGADYVPVGKDQQQHLEMARDVARRFELRYGPVLKAPEPLIDQTMATIPGLDGRKMSKSYDNVIPLFEEPTALRKKIQRIVTDSSPPSAPKDPTQSTLFDLYKGFATPEEIASMEAAYRQGIGWGEVKGELFRVISRELTPAHEAYGYWRSHPEKIELLLQEGGHQARSIAQKIYERVGRAMGLLA